MNDTPLEWIALGISVVGLVVAIAAVVFNYRYTARLWGMHEEYQALQRKYPGLTSDILRDNVRHNWPWWRFK